jgi:hypothetical protein
MYNVNTSSILETLYEEEEEESDSIKTRAIMSRVEVSI